MKLSIILAGFSLLLTLHIHADYSLPEVRAKYHLLVEPIAVEKAKTKESLGQLVFSFHHDATIGPKGTRHGKQVKLGLSINRMFMQDRIWSDGICVGVTKGPKSAASRVEEVRKDLEKNRKHRWSTADKTYPLLIEICEREDKTRFISYIQLFDAAAELPKYQKNWLRFDVHYATIDFIPPLLPETPAEFETLLRQHCRIDRDRMLGVAHIVTPEEIRQILVGLDKWEYNRTLDRKAYLRLVSEMRFCYVPATCYQKKTIAWLNEQYRYRSATSWPGKHAWWLMDRRPNGYMVMIQTDLDGSINWLFTDAPARSAEYTLHPDQLRLFLQIREIRGFHGMRFKGEKLFPKGRRLPASISQICGKYLKKNTYEFFSTASSHGAAHVFLTVEENSTVKNFDAMVARFAPMK